MGQTNVHGLLVVGCETQWTGACSMWSQATEEGVGEWWLWISSWRNPGHLGLTVIRCSRRTWPSRRNGYRQVKATPFTVKSRGDVNTDRAAAKPPGAGQEILSGILGRGSMGRWRQAWGRRLLSLAADGM